MVCVSAWNQCPCVCDVAGGRIDHAHHYNNARRALEETLAMETALQAAMTMLDPSNTLFVVTADHSHVMTLGGFGTKRGNPILGEFLARINILGGCRRRKLCSTSMPFALL
jgi:Alkaline phosphatase